MRPQFKSRKAMRRDAIETVFEAGCPSTISPRERRERQLYRGMVRTSTYADGSSRGNSRAYVHFPKVKYEPVRKA